MEKGDRSLLNHFFGSWSSIANILDSSAPATALPLFQSTVCFLWSAGLKLDTWGGWCGERIHNVPQVFESSRHSS